MGSSSAAAAANENKRGEGRRSAEANRLLKFWVNTGSCSCTGHFCSCCFTVRTSASRHSAAQRHLADTPTHFLKILFIIMLFLEMCLNYTHGLGVVSKRVGLHQEFPRCSASTLQATLRAARVRFCTSDFEPLNLTVYVNSSEH